MVHIIWVGMAAIGIIYAMFNGTIEEVNEVIFESANEAVFLVISLISILVFWLGLMRIAEESGLLNKLADFFKPLITRLFPDIPPNHPAMGYILSNFSANIFGLGNAATPLGIKAMKEMKKLNGDSDEASRSMITLLALNTSSVTLIPTTIIAIRMQYDSTGPTDIVISTIFATMISTIGAILVDRYFYYRRQGRLEYDSTIK
ncbi:nucleoside recognition domain-containing protein [Tenuibacillus multivorans]|uniref:Spore maturation protein A n=1 Tax=Tenuibacillus multivorans TaxID=237069 RepID=A0A1H0CYJ5_9BACI|nr:nucleoside recognition domain-containing protein [Tenuibacillus multivorans]GEL76117.1 spore maturation protein A [Tenuibacillus multivorans]SDN62866.1 spore maturation protein A [Tenuibacillus multivorans]